MKDLKISVLLYLYIIVILYAVFFASNTYPIENNKCKVIDFVDDKYKLKHIC